MFKLNLILLVDVLLFVSWANSHSCHCQPKPTCPSNEEFIKCGSLCQETCITRGQNCTRVGLGGVTCEDRCYCKKGYIRGCSEDAACIEIEACNVMLCPEPTTTPKPLINCTRPHEHYECGSACQTECKTLGEECSIKNKQCNHDCYCDEGYARDENKNCIPYEQCPYYWL